MNIFTILSQAIKVIQSQGGYDNAGYKQIASDLWQSMKGMSNKQRLQYLRGVINQWSTQKPEWALDEYDEYIVRLIEDIKMMPLYDDHGLAKIKRDKLISALENILRMPPRQKVKLTQTLRERVKELKRSIESWFAYNRDHYGMDGYINNTAIKELGSLNIAMQELDDYVVSIIEQNRITNNKYIVMNEESEDESWGI